MFPWSKPSARFKDRFRSDFVVVVVVVVVFSWWNRKVSARFKESCVRSVCRLRPCYSLVELTDVGENQSEVLRDCVFVVVVVDIVVIP